MAPLMMLAMPPETTLAVVTLVNLATSGQFLRRSLALCERTVIWPMAVAALPSIPLGVWLLTAADPEAVRRCVGGIVIGLSCLLALRPSMFGKPGRSKSAAVGFASGLLTGFGGIGGPPSVLYVMGLGMDTDRARATFLVYFSTVYPVAAVVTLGMGLVGWHEAALALAALPAFLLGGMAGAALYPRVARTRYKEVVLILLAGAGMVAAFG